MRNKTITHFILCSILSIILALLLGCAPKNPTMYFNPHKYSKCEYEALKHPPPYITGVFYSRFTDKFTAHIHSLHDLSTLPDNFTPTGMIYTRESAEIIIKKGLDRCFIPEKYIIYNKRNYLYKLNKILDNNL